MRNLQMFDHKGLLQKCVAVVSGFSLVCSLTVGAFMFGGCGQAGQGAGNGNSTGPAGNGAQNVPGAETIVYDTETVWKITDTVSLGKLEETAEKIANQEAVGTEGGTVRLRKFLSGSDGSSFQRLYDVTYEEGKTQEENSSGEDIQQQVFYGIAKYDLKGKLSECLKLPQWKREKGESAKVADAIIWKNITYLLTEDKLIVLAPDGGQTSFELDGWHQRELVLAENAPYLAELADGQTVLRKLTETGLPDDAETGSDRTAKDSRKSDIDNSAAGSEDSSEGEDIIIPVESEKIFATGNLEKDGAVYLSAGNRLFRYDTTSAETSLVLQWDKSGISDTYLRTILSANEQEIKILYYEQDTTWLKTLKPTTDKDGRVVLTVMTIDDGKIFRDMVYAFNQSNEHYRVEKKSPLGKPGVDASLEEWEEARTRLQLLLTTPQAPDLVDLGFLQTQNWESYAEQGVFEDLTPYLEASSVLDAKLYLPAALAGGQAAGQQVFVPRAFYMKMIYGQERYLGTENGWTLREFLDLREEHKDIPIFAAYYSAESVLDKLLSMSMEEFVDGEQNTCDFCNPLFYDLLACAAYEDTFTQERRWENYVSDRDRLLNGNALLDEAVVMDEVIYLWYTNVIETGKTGVGGNGNAAGDVSGTDEENGSDHSNREIRLTVKGYPSKDGASSGILCAASGDGVWMSGFCNLAISRMSSQKDGAWEFIEFAQEYEPDYGLMGFSVRKDRLERDLHTPRYTQKEMGGVPLREYTAEDEEKLTEIIGNLSHKTSQDEMLLKIVREEAQVYFRGQKSAEETAKVIQNRVQLYLWENE